MPNRRASRKAYYFFVQEKIPELRRRGLPVDRVADAIPYCSDDWALLREDEKKKYSEMAREWRAAQGKDSGPSEEQKFISTPLRRPGVLIPKPSVSPPDVSNLSIKNDQALLGGIFYFLNIFSHGELPPHCEQRFLPCEIGCVKYSLQEGIIADFHSFILPGEIPRGFRFHCQAASNSSHKIPISNFEFGHDQATVLKNLYKFIHPNPGNWSPIYCKSDDRARINWCLKRMEQASEIRQDLELLTVEDLVVGIYQQKFLKEPSKTWVRSLLDVAMWDYSSNTSPDDGFESKSLYESWLEKDPSPENKVFPRINKLGSGSDFEVYFQRLGIASARARYTKNRKTDKYSSYPLYHTIDETFELVENFYDPTFKKQLSVAQLRGALIYELADSVIIPFNIQDYAKALKTYAASIFNLSRKHEQQLRKHKVSFDSLFSAVTNFSEAASDFHRRLTQVDLTNPIAVRIVNDQLMLLERAFIDPLGLPGRRFYRHIIFAPSSHNKYAGESFPGIYDAMFDIENRADPHLAWAEVKKHISIAAFTIQAAAGTLTDVL